jgi:hypothetical protein
VRDLRAEDARVDAVLAASDARLVGGDMGGGRVTVVVSPSRNAAVAVLDGLAAPGDGRSYQLWMIDNGRYTSVDVLDSGTGRTYVAGLAPSFGITREPAGGSRSRISTSSSARWIWPEVPVAAAHCLGTLWM